MSEIRHPHDHFFQRTFSQREVALDFLHHYLPEPIAKLLDFSVLELTKDSFVDEALQDHFSDLLYQTRLLGGEEAYIYLLFEHKSYPAPLVAFQLLRYMVHIWEEMLQAHPDQGLRPIIPLVLYHGASQWKVAPTFGALLDGPEELRMYWPEFTYVLYDLAQYSDEELVGAALLQVALRVMKHIATGDLAQHLPGILGLLQDLVHQQSGLEYLYTVLRYVSQAGRNVSVEDIHAAVVKVFPEEGTVLMATAAEQWIERGKELGIAIGERQGIAIGERQGIAIGERQGMMAAIELGLELKFGVAGLQLLPAIRQIQNLDILRALYEGVKTANTLDELRTLHAALVNPGIIRP